MPYVIVLLGSLTALLQVIALREFVVLFSGNELDLGITLAAWLAAVGAGSAAGRRSPASWSLGAVVLSSFLLAWPLLSLVPHARPILGLEPGEALSLGRTIAATVLVLGPLCFFIGMQFPLAAKAIGGQTGSAYLFEAAGACIGGLLFTFVLSGRVPAQTVLMGVSAVGILLGAALLRSRVLALAALLPFVGILFWPHLFGRAGDAQELVSRIESRYGLIEVYRSRGQNNIYASGRFLYAYPDRPNEELRAHLPLLLHPRPERVLIVGGSPALVRETLKAGVSTVDFVDLDPALISVTESLLVPEDRQALADHRVTVRAVDARRFIKSAAGAGYDLIMLNLPEPATANANRCYTVEFFREARAALGPGGVVTLNLPVSFGYVGKRLQSANGSILRSLGRAFRYTAVSSEEYGILAGSDEPIETGLPELRGRLRNRQGALLPLHPFVVDDAFDPLKTAMHRNRLDAVHVVNRDGRPVAYLYNLLVWAEMQRSGALLFLADNGRALLVLLLAAAAAAGLVFRRRDGGAAYAVFLAGGTAMSFTVILLLAYQSVFGHVYERVGLLTAAFMAGSAAGALVSRTAARPVWHLRFSSAGLLITALAAPRFFQHELNFLAIALLVGALGGSVFSAAARFLAEDRTSAGRLYASDLAGAVLGALLTTLLTVPLFGMTRALLFLAALQSISLAVSLSAGHEKA